MATAAEMERWLEQARERASAPCGCSLDGRCTEHGRMMEAIHTAWRSGGDTAALVLWGLQDGYGEPGFVPEQGYDWSGIRDSTVPAIEAMYAALHA